VRWENTCKAKILRPKKWNNYVKIYVSEQAVSVWTEFSGLIIAQMVGFRISADKVSRVLPNDWPYEYKLQILA